eukprot:FR742228.1.p1 GENE.FR742228.1~~FR742228.1.p1  ORF type:complete len:243 (-),score=84.61 FR742228.1:14-742(-)
MTGEAVGSFFGNLEGMARKGAGVIRLAVFLDSLGGLGPRFPALFFRMFPSPATKDHSGAGCLALGGFPRPFPPFCFFGREGRLGFFFPFFAPGTRGGFFQEAFWELFPALPPAVLGPGPRPRRGVDFSRAARLDFPGFWALPFLFPFFRSPGFTFQAKLAGPFLGSKGGGPKWPNSPEGRKDFTPAKRTPAKIVAQGGPRAPRLNPRRGRLGGGREGPLPSGSFFRGARFRGRSFGVGSPGY